jgi:hypothetical protein
LVVPELFVAFACDTEDNHPNYVPGWTKLGSDYDRNPAILKWSWTQYWDNLSEFFISENVPVSWLLRVDKGPVLDKMLILFKNKILDLKSVGDEIGIHIHTFDWNSDLSRWVQTHDPQKQKEVVLYSLDVFKKNLGFAASSIRMGWNTMSNEIMRTINTNALRVDASAIPGTSCQGKFSKRDNMYDWSRTPYGPYHPSFEDYQARGNMKILEIPLSTLKTKKSGRFSKVVNRLSSFPSLSKLLPIARFFNLTPHHHFYISPYWSSSIYDRIIEAYYKQTINNGLAFLVGYFHGCDILNPVNLKLNTVFEEHLNKIFKKINSITGVDVKFVTLSQMAEKYNSYNENKNLK